MVQSGITLVLTLCFYFLGTDGKDTLTGAYIYQYGLLAILGTMAILIVQAVCSFAVIWYFHVKKEHPGNGITTGLIPFLGGIGMLFVVYLLIDNLEFAGGLAAESPFFKAIPWIVDRHLRHRPGRHPHPAQHATRSSTSRIGRTVMEEAQERDHAAGH